MSYAEPNPIIDGWMSMRELEFLYERAGEMRTIVEIGSWMGKSTHALLSGCKDGIVISVDHFNGSPGEIEGAHALARTEDIYRIFKKNVGGFPNLAVLKMDSIKASRFFKDKSIEMVFFDGDHAYPHVKDEIKAWIPKCKKLLCGHDCNQDGIPRALEELKLNPTKGLLDTIWSLEI